MLTMPALRTPASDNMRSVTARVRTLEPSFAKRTTESSFSTTVASPVRSGLTVYRAAKP